MDNRELCALRRFCYIVIAGCLAVLVICLFSLVSGWELPLGICILIFALLMITPSRIDNDLSEYLQKGKRPRYERAILCLCFLLIGFVIYAAGKLDPYNSLIFMLAMCTFNPLLDVLHALRQIQHGSEK